MGSHGQGRQGSGLGRGVLKVLGAGGDVCGYFRGLGGWFV